MGSALQPILFPHPPRQRSAQFLNQQADLIWLQTPNGGKTPAIMALKPNAKLTLLYTHGNAEDLGELAPVLPQMADACDASVFAVEYPGYSISEAEGPSEEYCYEAVEAAYQYLTETLRIPPAQVVPFGRSLGSGPAVHLASAHPEIKAMVLQSPLESGARVLGWKALGYIASYIDPFKNYVKIGDVQAMTFIAHGKADRVVPCSNGEGLYEALKARNLAAEPLWIEGRGHNDMPNDQVMRRVNQFLKTVA